MKKSITLITTLLMSLSSNINSMDCESVPTASLSSIPQRTSTQGWKNFVTHPAANWLLKRYAQHHRELPCYTLKGHHDCLTYLLFNKNGNLLFSGARNGAVLVWNVTTGELIKVLVKFDGGIYALGLDTNDQQDMYLDVLCQNSEQPYIQKTDRLYAINNMALHFRVNIESGEIKRLDDSDTSIQPYIPDPFNTRYLRTDSVSSMAELIDCKGNPLVTFNSHKDVIHAVAFDPHGSFLATGSADKTICLWDLSLGLSSKLTQAQADLLTKIYGYAQAESTLILTNESGSASTFHSLPKRIKAALEKFVTLPAYSRQKPVIHKQKAIRPQPTQGSFWPSWQTLASITSILAGGALIGITVLNYLRKR